MLYAYAIPQFTVKGIFFYMKRAIIYAGCCWCGYGVTWICYVLWLLYSWGCYTSQCVNQYVKDFSFFSPDRCGQECSILWRLFSNFTMQNFLRGTFYFRKGWRQVRKCVTEWSHGSVFPIIKLGEVFLAQVCWCKNTWCYRLLTLPLPFQHYTRNGGGECVNVFLYFQALGGRKSVWKKLKCKIL